MSPFLKRILFASLFCGLLVYADLPTRKPHPGHSRIKLSIHTESGRPTGVRLRVTNAAGEYFAPLGHLPQVDTINRVGDLVLGDDETMPRELHALVHDGALIDLPRGEYTFTARKGFEYEEVRLPVSVTSDEPRAVSLPLHKFDDFESRGWYPGDTHIHYPDSAGIRYEMECEGLRVCSLLLLKSGYKEPVRPGAGHFWNAQRFTGKLDPVSDDRYFVKVGEEFRHGLLAHLIFQNLKSVVWPVSTGGLREGGAGGFDWPLMLHASDDAHEQGALVTWAHWPYPSLEAPLDIALGRIDSIDLLTTGSPFEHHPILVDIYKMHGPAVYSMPPIEVYYHYLNCGFRLAASSGSDKMALNPPMGSARTYVKTDGPLSYDSWIEGIRKGRTFVSTYPLLEFSVNGKEAGDTLRLEQGKAKLAIRARAASLEPYDVLEIIHNGRVVRSAKPSGETHAAEISTELEVGTGGWIAARAYGRKMLPYGATWWQQPVFAHTSPIYLDIPGEQPDAGESAKLFLEQIAYFEDWAKNRARFPTPANRDETIRLIEQTRSVYRELIP